MQIKAIFLGICKPKNRGTILNKISSNLEFCLQISRKNWEFWKYMMWVFKDMFPTCNNFSFMKFRTCGDSLLINDSLEVSFWFHEFVLILLEIVWVLSSLRFFSRILWHNHAVWLWSGFWICLLQVCNSSGLILSAVREFCLLKILLLLWKVLFWI